MDDQMNKEKNGKKRRHIILTSHPGQRHGDAMCINWNAPTPEERGPIIATTTSPMHRNCIGTHSGSYSVYKALAIASGSLDPDHLADLTDTHPVANLGPYPSWTTPGKIVSLDPFGAGVLEYFSEYLAEGYDIRPTIAVTQARIKLPEIIDAVKEGRLIPDGNILMDNYDCRVFKAAIEPVWYLPGIAERFGVSESDLRRALFEHTGGMYPELVTRSDLEIFLPPIGGITVYIFGDPAYISDPDKDLAVRVHDECNGSDVFGSDICTCRPYLAHGIEVCIKSAQNGGAGVIVYNRKEGRALGEVTKFLVYNARKRQEGGDSAENYFVRTECVAGTQDVRFQELMPDVLHWLGITRIDEMVSMSNVKYQAIVKSGIDIVKRTSIPEHLIPEDAYVEIVAKKAAGYFTDGDLPDESHLVTTRGRKLELEK